MIERREEDRKYNNIELGFLPRSASWIEEMEKRSHRRIRDLVAHPAFQGLDVSFIRRVGTALDPGSRQRLSACTVTS